MLFVCQNLIEICVVGLQLAILIKISRKAAHALLQTKKEEMLENLGATDIQLIPVSQNYNLARVSEWKIQTSKRQ